MRRYETVIIINPDLSEEHHTSIFDKLNELIKQHGGLLIETDNWGNKKLAYEIKKKNRGHYIRFDFCTNVTMINEMEYSFKINDNILKFMTVLLDKKVDLEAIKKTMEKSEVEKQEKDTQISKN